MNTLKGYGRVNIKQHEHPKGVQKGKTLNNMNTLKGYRRVKLLNNMNTLKGYGWVKH
jgi:hypothetical protein